MLLKFLGENNDSGPVGKNCPFVIGEAYEVAEIFEHPWHIMLRKPGDTDWPRPGDPMFGWHPDFFERTETPIPIISCGYVYADHMSDCFGVLLDDPEAIAKVQKFEEIEDAIVDQHDIAWVMDEEDYESWHTRMGHMYPNPVARCVYDLEQSPIGTPAIHIPENVHLTEHGLYLPFATVAYSTQEMVEHDVSNSQAQNNINTFLKSLSIGPHPARILYDVAWWSIDEKPRLINPPGCTVSAHRMPNITEGICPQCGQPYKQ